MPRRSRHPGDVRTAQRLDQRPDVKQLIKERYLHREGNDVANARAADFEARAEQCAGQAAAGCAPLPDGEASVEHLRHLVFLHARQALRDAFARAS
jgi:hypothetical protein